MGNHVSNEDIKQCMPAFPKWWASKTQAEKDWYIRFWRHCSNL